MGLFLVSSPYPAWNTLQPTFSVRKTKFNPCGACTAKADAASMVWFDLAHFSCGSALSTRISIPVSACVQWLKVRGVSNNGFYGIYIYIYMECQTFSTEDLDADELGNDIQAESTQSIQQPNDNLRWYNLPHFLGHPNEHWDEQCLLLFLHCLKYNHLNHVSSSILIEDAMTLAMVAMASYVFERSSVSGPRLNLWKSEYLKLSCGDWIWSSNSAVWICVQIQEVELGILMAFDKITVSASVLLW